MRNDVIPVLVLAIILAWMLITAVVLIVIVADTQAAAEGSPEQAQLKAHGQKLLAEYKQALAQEKAAKAAAAPAPAPAPTGPPPLTKEQKQAYTELIQRVQKQRKQAHSRGTGFKGNNEAVREAKAYIAADDAALALLTHEMQVGHALACLQARSDRNTMPAGEFAVG